MKIKVRECETDDYVLRVNVLVAVDKLKLRYPNFVPAIDEAFEELV